MRWLPYPPYERHLLPTIPQSTTTAQGFGRPASSGCCPSRLPRSFAKPSLPTVSYDSMTRTIGACESPNHVDDGTDIT